MNPQHDSPRAGFLRTQDTLLVYEDSRLAFALLLSDDKRDTVALLVSEDKRNTVTLLVSEDPL